MISVRKYPIRTYTLFLCVLCHYIIIIYIHINYKSRPKNKAENYQVIIVNKLLTMHLYDRKGINYLIWVCKIYGLNYVWIQ